MHFGAYRVHFGSYRKLHFGENDTAHKTVAEIGKFLVYRAAFETY